MTDRVYDIMEQVISISKDSYEDARVALEKQHALVDSFDDWMDAAMAMHVGWFNAIMTTDDREALVIATMHHRYWAEVVKLIAAAGVVAIEKAKSLYENYQWHRKLYMRTMYEFQIMQTEDMLNFIDTTGTLVPNRAELKAEYEGTLVKLRAQLAAVKGEMDEH